jgi:hypothetical protein
MDEARLAPAVSGGNTVERGAASARVSFLLSRILRGAFMRATYIVVAATFAIACTSHKGATNGKGGTVVADGSACAKICEASAACGDTPEVCEPKCQDWLVARARPGIATETALCAVPRIDGVCANAETARVAATALVSCIDEAGRKALAKDKTSLFVAARAICEHSVRCNDAPEEKTVECVQQITNSKRIPRGLGIFGAMKPALVERFAQCMAMSACGPGGGASACFGEMLGEEDDGTPDEDDETPATPPNGKPPVEEQPETPGTKI